MSDRATPAPPHMEDAFSIIVSALRVDDPRSRQRYGYDVYLPLIISRHLAAAYDITDGNERLVAELSPPFYAAAWDMCRRGILRPGVRKHRDQATDDGAGGNGYSVTPTGLAWLERVAEYDYAPLEPGRLSGLLEKYLPRYGIGFRDRAQEALRCYAALAYFGCCAMCGAAAESIMLAVAIAKTGDEQRALRIYESSGGRGRIEQLILQGKPEPVQRDFRGSSSLLKYWRDSAAHGQPLQIGDSEAYTSLVLLLRFAQFADDRWSILTLA